MNNYAMRCVCLFITLLIMSCSNPEDKLLDKMEQIKELGNENPQQALAMHDSIELEIRNENDYIKNKYDLLQIRLNDKAYNLPISDIMIKQLLPYFEEKGSVSEKQEVYYYAGSTYRDLQDTPRALEYFFKSLDCALDNMDDCDFALLRNTYSNLSYLYYNVKDYANALQMGIKELDCCRQTKTDDVLPLIHIGAIYHALDSVQCTEAALDSAYAHIIQSGDMFRYQESLVYLLYHYARLNMSQKAKKCIELISSNPLVEFDANSCMAFALYYKSLEMNDSAIIFLNRVLEDGTDINNMYDAAKCLFYIHSKKGDVANACKYAEAYLQLSDSLDFGKRQELAATVNNQYQYHLDQKREQRLKEEKNRYKHTLAFVSLASLLLVSIGYILYIRKRNRHLKVIAGLSSELQRISDNDRQLQEDIKKKEKELNKSKKSLENTSNELNNVKQELQRVNNELTEYNEALKEKEEQLAERMEQNKSFIKLLHQSELEGKAEDVIHAIRQSSKGKKDMESADWKQLFKAVDDLHPTFKDKLLKELGNFTEDQKRVCYLMRIGLSKPQIQSLTNLSRVTIWRWVKKYDWVFSLEG